jgi:ubiquinone/menaquinone biosynthesis C-methylase UbiE
LVPRDLPTYLEQETLFDALQKAAQGVQGGWLLDIGCGNQPYAHLFPNVARYVGVDLPQPSGMQRCADVWASGLHLPFAGQSFDTVLCAQVLEHVPQPQQLMEEAFRVLKTGGQFILTAPQTWCLHEEPHDYYRFTQYGLRYLLESAGFEVQSIEARGGSFRVIGQTFLNLYYLRNRIPRATRWLRAFTSAFNTLFGYLDRRWPWEKDTLGYIARAIRPGQGAAGTA